MDFPSVSRLNTSLAVSGMLRDLNHHLKPFRHMASITLADWACLLKCCVDPLNNMSSSSFLHRPQIPYTWSLAHSTLRHLSLSVRSTDLSYIISGDVSLSHLYTQSLLFLPVMTPKISPRVLSNFEKHNYFLLKHFGRFVFPSTLPQYPQFLSFHLHFPNSQYYLTRDLPLLISWFQILPSLLLVISNGDYTLFQSRTEWQEHAENIILSLIRNSTLRSISAPPHTSHPMPRSRPSHPLIEVRLPLLLSPIILHLPPICYLLICATSCLVKHMVYFQPHWQHVRINRNHVTW